MNASAIRFQPRLWPAIAIVLVAASILATVPFLFTRTMIHFAGLVAAPILGSLGILLWWLVASRVRGAWQWRPVFLVVGFVLGLLLIVYREIATAMYPFFYYAPVLAVVWVLWLCLSRPFSWAVQRRGLMVVLLGTCGVLSLVRIDSADVELVPHLRWVWQLTDREAAERQRDERLKEAKPSIGGDVIVREGDWAAFRGPNRDSVCLGTIAIDWEKHPPRELWRHRVGPGRGSFAIVGERAYTQEQLDEQHEALICYHAATGQELWIAKIPGLFKDGQAGEGPRATPTVHEGKVYAFSATGKLGAFDAASGQQLWLCDVTALVGAKTPQWGFASSPLVLDGKVMVFVGAKDKSVAAFHTTSGELAWASGSGTHGYSSPHRATLHGQEQVLCCSDFGVEAYRPSTGERLWAREWPIPGLNRVAQPTLLGNNEILLGTPVGGQQGGERFRVNADGTTTQLWRKKVPKQYFNDGVVFEGHYYGWDDRNFVCIDLQDGAVKWNAGSGYGFGQVLLLKEQKTLLVQTVQGRVVLVEASPAEHNEVSKLDALAGETWNHPVIANGRLYLRNNAEAACYDVSER